MTAQTPKIAVIGMGYVGLVGAVCLAKLGYDVIGMDVDKERIEGLKNGKLPIYEPGLEDTFNEVRDKLEFTDDIKEAISKSNLCFVCVGTPSRPDGKVDLSYVEQVSEEIGNALKDKSEHYVVCFRSTIPPGTSENMIIPRIEKNSGKKRGEDFSYAFNPEFLREGSAIEDFFDPPKTIIGSKDEKAINELLRIYNKIPGLKITLPIPESEIVKYVDNTWHALKVAFANEVGLFSKACDADGRLIMDVFVKDTKLNISPVYLKPGFAFGGSCLPKDVKGLVSIAEEKNLLLPLVRSIMLSNENIIERSKELIEKHVPKSETVAIVGLSFKPDTDDVRESPAVYLAKKLKESGYKLRYYDPLVTPEHIKRYFGENFLPIEAEEFYSSLDELLENEKNIVFTGSFRNVPRNSKVYEGKTIFDFGGVFYKDSTIDRDKTRYYALSW